eukprot:SAG11_NODE_163_length_13928_cov_29.869188_16_plen_86_part_00
MVRPYSCTAVPGYSYRRRFFLCSVLTASIFYTAFHPDFNPSWIEVWLFALHRYLSWRVWVPRIDEQPCNFEVRSASSLYGLYCTC